jgi:tetratricopeptide (TPR) repeat protein
MFLAALLILSQTASTAPQTPEERLKACLKQAATHPALAVDDAQQWRSEGGGYKAQQCLGVAYAGQQRWAGAAAAFEIAAQEAAAAKDEHAADYWALAGNAWLGAGEAEKALTALNSALDAGALSGSALGEAQLDRARARVAGGDMSGARDDLDGAIVNAPEDPLAWLLSATLWRRMDNLPRAAKDITQALRMAGDDPSVHLEEGYIAALAGEDVAARAAFARVLELAPGTPQADQARAGLAQLGTAQH